MTTGAAVHIAKLGKRYEIGAGVDFGDRLTERLTRLRGRERMARDAIWALRDVSIDIAEGEALGVIGRNGAGKSTLLKILSRITYPTEGQAVLRGRVAALLEVGTGFHPDLTGRDNIYLNGAILGMPRSEIRRKFDEIVQFAEVERFLDMPVKRYSSGMYVRLAFAVAAHLEPDILLIDEVLSVGDAAFQRKCLGRMHDAARSGRTVIFVSHDLGAVSNLTTRAVLLAGGSVVADGPTPEVIKGYLSAGRGRGQGPVRDVEAYRRAVSTPGPVRITSIRCGSANGGSMELGDTLAFDIDVDVSRAVEGITVTAVIKDEHGRAVAVLFSPDQGYTLTSEPGRASIGVEVRDLPLSPGAYYADVGLNRNAATVAYDVLQDFPLVDVRNSGQIVQWLDRPFGGVHPRDVTWESIR